MGGHGHHAIGNEHNLKETDEEMLHKIQRIDTIKHMPNHWHMEFFDANNMHAILGGNPTLGYAAFGGFVSLAYYQNRAAHLPRNFYAHNMHVAGRFLLGAAIGLSLGYLQFGDRQRLHNAWVAERLRRRYPESMALEAHDLWKLKGVKAPQDFYKWQ